MAIWKTDYNPWKRVRKSNIHLRVLEKEKRCGMTKIILEEIMASTFEEPMNGIKFPPEKSLTNPKFLEKRKQENKRGGREETNEWTSR